MLNVLSIYMAIYLRNLEISIQTMKDLDLVCATIDFWVQVVLGSIVLECNFCRITNYKTEITLTSFPCDQFQTNGTIYYKHESYGSI